MNTSNNLGIYCGIVLQPISRVGDIFNDDLKNMLIYTDFGTI